MSALTITKENINESIAGNVTRLNFSDVTLDEFKIPRHVKDVDLGPGCSILALVLHERVDYVSIRTAEGIENITFPKRLKRLYASKSVDLNRLQINPDQHQIALLSVTHLHMLTSIPQFFPFSGLELNIKSDKIAESAMHFTLPPVHTLKFISGELIRYFRIVNTVRKLVINNCAKPEDVVIPNMVRELVLGGELSGYVIPASVRKLVIMKGAKLGTLRIPTTVESVFFNGESDLSDYVIRNDLILLGFSNFIPPNSSLPKRVGSMTYVSGKAVTLTEPLPTSGDVLRLENVTLSHSEVAASFHALEYGPGPGGRPRHKRHARQQEPA